MLFSAVGAFTQDSDSRPVLAEKTLMLFYKNIVLHFALNS
jgi:hypothetical protein